MEDLKGNVRRAIYHDVEKLFRGLYVFRGKKGKPHKSLYELGDESRRRFLDSLGHSPNTSIVLQRLYESGVPLRKIFHSDELPAKPEAPLGDRLAAATSRRLMDKIRSVYGNFKRIAVRKRESKNYAFMPPLLLHALSEEFDRLLFYFFSPGKARLSEAKDPKLENGILFYENEEYFDAFFSEEEPVGHVLSSHIYLSLSEKPGIEKVDKRDFRLRTTLYRSEEVNVPAIPLGVHIALSAAFEASGEAEEFAFTHVTLIGYKRVISHLPHTFTYAERGYLKLLRAINAIFYAYLLGALYALSKELRECCRYYHGIIFSPADMMLVYRYTRDFEQKLRSVLADLYAAFERPIKVSIGDSKRLQSLRIVPSYTIFKAIREPRAKYVKEDNRYKQEDFGPLVLVSPLAKPAGILAKPKEIDLSAIKKGSRFLVLIVEHEGKVYPIVLVRQSDGSFKELLKFDLSGSVKASKAVRILYKRTGSLRAHLEERLKLSNELDGELILGRLKVLIEPPIGLLIHPQEDVENLDELYSGRVLHRRFVYRDPLSIYRERTYLGITYYAALVLEAVHVLGLDLWPLMLLQLRPFVIASTRDESYLITKPGRPSDEFLSALRLLDEHGTPMELILQDYDIKKPIYAARAETDEFVRLSEIKRPFAYAFGIPLRLSELADAFELRVKKRSSLINYTRFMSKFLTEHSEELLKAIKEGSDYWSKLNDKEEFLRLAAYTLTRLEESQLRHVSALVARKILELLESKGFKEAEQAAKLMSSSDETRRYLEIVADVLSTESDLAKRLYELLVISARMQRSGSDLYALIGSLISKAALREDEELLKDLLLLMHMLLLMNAYGLSYDELFSVEGDPVKEMIELCVAARLAEIIEEKGERLWS